MLSRIFSVFDQNVKTEPTPISMAGEIIEKHLTKNTFQRDENTIKELRRICGDGERIIAA